jgi:hypothetical protein
MKDSRDLMKKHLIDGMTNGNFTLRRALLFLQALYG